MPRKTRFIILMLLFQNTVWADCTGEVRAVTPEEKRLADWVHTVFHGLIRISGDYALDKMRAGSSRDFRCIDTPGQPYYLSTGFRYSPQGKVAESLSSSAAEISADMQKMMNEIQQMQQSGASMEALAARMESQDKRLDRQQNKIRAQSGVKVKAYFNVNSAKCGGQAVKISGAYTACRRAEKGHDELVVLFGQWRESDPKRGVYNALFVDSVPMAELQVIATNIPAAPGTLDKMIQKTNWSAIAGRIGK